MEANENTSAERCTFRYLVAQIVLATNVPMPEDIGIYNEGCVSLRLANVAEAEAWGVFLGSDVRAPSELKGTRYANVDNAQWHGWNLQFHGNEPVRPDSDIDADTTAALREVES